MARTRMSPQSTHARNLVSARGSDVSDHRKRQISSFSSAFNDLHACRGTRLNHSSMCMT